MEMNLVFYTMVFEKDQKLNACGVYPLDLI